MSKITNINRYILDFRVIPVFVLLIYAFVMFVSPFVVRAQESHGYSLIQLEGSGDSGDVYLTNTSSNGKFKRLIHRNAINNGLYSWITQGITEVDQSTLDSFENFEVVAHNPQGRYAQDEQGLQIPPELYLIRKDRGVLTIKRLAMRSPSVILSEYMPRDGINPSVFEVSKQEIDLYTQGDPIYYTGTDSWESNVYRKTDTLISDERGTRIYRTIIPTGKNECTITGYFLAVIGKPGVGYATIRPGRTSFEQVPGGNVTIYLQQTYDAPSQDILSSNPRSFTLICEQSESLPKNTIHTSPSTRTFSKTGTGPDSLFLVFQDSDDHSCSLVQGKRDYYITEKASSPDDNPKYILITNQNAFIYVKAHNDQTTSTKWTLHCHKISTIAPLQEGIVNEIRGSGPGTLRLNLPQDTLTLECLHRQTDVGFIWGSKKVAYTKDWTSPTIYIPGTPYRGRLISNFVSQIYIDSNAAPYYLTALYDTPRTKAWTINCTTSNLQIDGIEQLFNSKKNTPLISGFVQTTTSSETYPDNPNLLRNVIAEADGVHCANHLLDIDEVIGNLLVPPGLCIKYTEQSPGLLGSYFYNTNVIHILSPRFASVENFNAVKGLLQFTLLHELCHAQQAYYTLTTELWSYMNPQWTRSIAKYEWKDGRWHYPETGLYYGMYGTPGFYAGAESQPLELGAEFCSIFAAVDAGEREIVEPRFDSPLVNANNRSELDVVLENDEAHTWVREYMLNPNLEPFAPQLTDIQDNLNINISNVRFNNAKTKISFQVSLDNLSPENEVATIWTDNNLSPLYEIKLEYTSTKDLTPTGNFVSNDIQAVGDIAIYDASQTMEYEFSSKWDPNIVDSYIIYTNPKMKYLDNTIRFSLGSRFERPSIDITDQVLQAL